MRLIPGIVSVTFRQLKFDEIISLCKENNLSAIEWGGDVHVPMGDGEIASIVGKETEKADISIPEYGSYYRVGASPKAEIDKVVYSAGLLKTNVIRVWGYVKSLPNCTSFEYENAVLDAKRICELYPETIFCLECHQGTLTENYKDALKFLMDVNHDNFKMFWQPNQFKSHEENIEALQNLLPYVKAVHVFSWDQENGETRLHPLEFFEKNWKEYIEILKTSKEEEIPMMLEFMHDGRKESLPEAARTLLSWIK